MVTQPAWCTPLLTRTVMCVAGIGNLSLSSLFSYSKKPHHHHPRNFPSFRFPLSLLLSHSLYLSLEDRMGASDGELLRLFEAETDWYSDVVLGGLLTPWWDGWRSLPRPAQSWLRNYVGGTLLYLVSGFLWSFYIYFLKRNVYLPKDAIPSNKAMALQIVVAMKAMPLYCALPTLSEYMVEKGWTRCYSSITDVGWPAHIVYLAIYLIIVEFGIYWMHRELHDIKLLYKYLHATHHIYNKQNTLSPFAGLAFNPLDGILQAVPHVIALFLVPIQLMTHMGLLFIEAVWTANIHDCIDGKVWPIMGAGYHTIHHTTYKHNYGHYTIWMDHLFGTLRNPEEDVKKVNYRKKHPLGHA